MHLPSPQPRSISHFSSSRPAACGRPAPAWSASRSDSTGAASTAAGAPAPVCARRARPVPSLEEDGVEGFEGGQLRHAHRRLRQDTEPPFRTEHHFAQVDAGGRRGKGRDGERAGRGFDLAAREHALDAAVAQRLLAGRTRDDPAAQGRVFEGLREVAERVAVGAQLRFQVRAGDAGAESRQLRLAVERGQRAQAPHVDAQRAAARPHRQVAGDAGAAAVGNHRGAIRGGIGQQFAHLRGALGKRDAVGHRAQAAVAQAQPVGQALAECMQGALRRRIRPADAARAGSARWRRRRRRSWRPAAPGRRRCARPGRPAHPR